jgi:hypothetical protein
VANAFDMKALREELKTVRVELQQMDKK